MLAAPASADTVAKVYADFQNVLDRHLREKDLEHDGLASAFDYQAALQSIRNRFSGGTGTRPLEPV